MSTADNDSDDDFPPDICANCGKGEDINNKLKACMACKMFKYCNRECQIAHRPQHKKECRKRAADLHDEELFKQPPPLDDCPICFIRLPSLESGYRYQTCCGKMICGGCGYAPVFDNQGNVVREKKCAFCRTTFPTSEGNKERERTRVELNDPIAIYNIGHNYFTGSGYPQDYNKALELFHQATQLGFSKAFASIGYAYHNGQGLEVDMKKARYYYELAAMGGCEDARYNLGLIEKKAGNMDRALKHHKIAVRDGYSDSLNQIKRMYGYGYATKDDYTAALRLYQVYLGEIKSSQRDKAAEEDERYHYY